MDKNTFKVKEDKFKDLLKNILTSVTSNPNKYNTIQKMNSRSFRGLVKDGGSISTKDITKLCEYYLFPISDDKKMIFNYSLRITKSVNGFFCKDRYVCLIDVYKSENRWTPIESFIIDSDFYKSPDIFKSLKRIFHFMEIIEVEETLRIESEKYNPYISDITNSVNKTVVRDDKLNELLK